MQKLEAKPGSLEVDLAKLRTRGIRYLFLAGMATDVCVESTLHDAYFQDYWPILVADSAMPAGPAGMHEAALFNVENYFGWTVRAQELLRVLGSSNS